MVWSPSMMSSSIPVTMTSWAMFQLELVNVNNVGKTVASPVSPDVTLMLTSVPGWVLRITVNVSVEPDSETTVEPSETTTVTPAESSSVVVTSRVRLGTLS